MEIKGLGTLIHLQTLNLEFNRIVEMQGKTIILKDLLRDMKLEEDLFRCIGSAERGVLASSGDERDSIEERYIKEIQAIFQQLQQKDYPSAEVIISYPEHRYFVKILPISDKLGDPLFLILRLPLGKSYIRRPVNKMVKQFNTIFP